MPLAIAAKVDKSDYAYYTSQIKPLLKDPLVEFLGEIGEDEKRAFLGDATAVLFPIDWPEPFGLSMIEAMANGTPVIAFRRGSVPEVIDHGVTGFVVDTIEEAVGAVPLAKALDRTAVRRRFEERFSAGRMAQDYVALYRERLGRGIALPDAQSIAIGACNHLRPRSQTSQSLRARHGRARAGEWTRVTLGSRKGGRIAYGVFYREW